MKDPRCPSCGEKVSATARWCMHCSADFDDPVDRGDSGEEATVFADGEADATGTVRTDTGSVDAATATVGAGAADVERSADGFDPGESDIHPAVAPVVRYLGAAEERRQALSVGVPLALWLALGSSTPLSGVVLAAGALLGIYMFTRDTAAETLAAGASGAGLLVLGLRAAEVGRVALLEGPLAAVGPLTGSLVTVAVGVGLLIAGRRL